MNDRVTTLSCSSETADQTRALGRRLGEIAQPGDVFLFAGPLGAGKTACIQGIGQGLGVKEPINSPTFVLLKEYSGRLPLYHFDLYRLTNVEHTVLHEWSEFLNGSGVCAVEWADLALDLLPPQHLLLEFAIESDTKRSIKLTASGERCARFVADPQLCC